MQPAVYIHNLTPLVITCAALFTVTTLLCVKMRRGDLGCHLFIETINKYKEELKEEKDILIEK